LASQLTVIVLTILPFFRVSQQRIILQIAATKPDKGLFMGQKALLHLNVGRHLPVCEAASFHISKPVFL
jgi:hypothetical protein